MTLRRLSDVEQTSFVVSKTSSFVGFAALIIVRGVDADESITSFDVCRINLCDSLNA